MKVSDLLMGIACKNFARARQCEDKVKFRAELPLRLRNRVSGKHNSDKEKGCLSQMSILLACLAKNNYENKRCSKEIEEFYGCYNNYATNKRALKENREKGVLTPNATSLNHREVNILLKRYPNP